MKSGAIMATTSSASSGTMQAVVFQEPFKVTVEQVPIPTVQDPEDVVIKVGYTALCGRYVGIAGNPGYTTPEYMAD